MKMHIVATTALVVMLALSVALYAQETDPSSVVMAIVEPLNAGGIDTMMAFFADDAVVKLVPALPPGSPDTFTGAEEIRAWFEGLVAMNFEIHIEVLQVEGDTVTTKTSTWADPTREMGVAPLVATEVYTVQDGKIKGFTWTISDESLAKLQAAMAALPETGGTNPTGTLPLWLGVGGLLLLALGVGLRWAFGRAR